MGLIDSIPFLITLWIIALFIANSELRKGSLKKTQPHYTESFFTDLPPYKTFKIIMAFATNNGYRIDDFDEENLRVILNERISLTSYGSLYPIYVRDQAGRTMVEVGVTSKLGKIGLLSPFNKKMVTLRHERMFNAIKAAIFAASPNET